MSYPRYPEYKDSGVDWLGEVPKGWSFAPLWSLFRRTKQTGYEQEELLSVYRDYGVIPKSSRADNFNNPSEDLSPYQLVVAGDMVINKMKAWQGSVAISEFRGIVSPAYFVYTATHKHNPKYLHYLLRADQYIAAYLSVSKGIRINQWDLDPQYHSRLPVLLPSVKEQQTIVAFLDSECSKTDALIMEQEKLITLLQEKRQAVISHAVTKGLNPDVPMKDSCVEWLGDVPRHWKVHALGYVYEIALGKMLDEKRITGNHLANYLRNIDVQWGRINIAELPEMDFQDSELQRYSLKYGDLLVCEGGDVGRSAIWKEELPECYYQKALHRLRPRCKNQVPYFLYYVLYAASKLGIFSEAEGKATIVHLTAEKLKRHTFPFPPFSEQYAIVEYLNTVSAKIDALITEAEKGVALLKERKGALIAAAVTGKIDVRGLVPAQAQEAV